MPRANAMAPMDAIRIEDEVWQEAFTRREPVRPSRERRLQAIDGELPDWLVETSGKTLSDEASWSVPRSPKRERAASARTATASARSASIEHTHSSAEIAPTDSAGQIAPTLSSASIEHTLSTAPIEPILSSAPIVPILSIPAAPEAVESVAAVASLVADHSPDAAPFALDTTRPPALGDAVSTPAGGPPARRTVKIQGRGAERNLPLPDSSRRRARPRAYERSGFRPDRLAMWAVMLGFLLVLIAIASAH